MDEYAVAGAEQTPEPALLSSAALAEIAELAGMPGIKVDAAVERLLTDVAEDFVVQVSTFAGALSRHRRAPMVEDRDIELALDKVQGVRTTTSLSSEGVPPLGGLGMGVGYGGAGGVSAAAAARRLRRVGLSENHAGRMQMLRVARDQEAAAAAASAAAAAVGGAGAAAGGGSVPVSGIPVGPVADDGSAGGGGGGRSGLGGTAARTALGGAHGVLGAKRKR